MTQEQKRGCGYRKVGGTYLVGDYIPISCDRLPYPLEVCPICGQGIKVGRGMTKINPVKLFGVHHGCKDNNPHCFLCQPKSEVGYLMRVGEKFYKTPEDFLIEGSLQGFSKRIAQIPRDFKVGKTVVYLCHKEACPIKGWNGNEMQEFMPLLNENQPKLVDADKVAYKFGIFAAFIPQRIEKLYWQSALDDMPKSEIAKLKKRGITPIGIKDNDKDHR